MKSKEEIEQLAEQYLQKNKHNFDTWKEIEHTKISHINAYTQCQEDMAENKYTEEDMLKAFEKGALYGSTKNGNTHYFDEVINSLNKQD